MKALCGWLLLGAATCIPFAAAILTVINKRRK